MIGTDATLAGIVSEVALLCPTIERTYGIRTKRTETHCRDVEDGSRIRFRAFWPANHEPEFFGSHRFRGNGMVHPLIALLIDIVLCAERPFVEIHFGALIHHGTDIA